MTRDDYKLLGSVVKTHGISGEVVIRSSVPIKGMNKNLKSLMVEIDGLLVPFSIISWHFLKDNEIVMEFRDIDSKKKADKLKGKDIFIFRKEITNTSIGLNKNNLSGFRVIDIKIGEIGITKGILEVPGNNLFQVEYRKREILLPIQEGMILEINTKKKLIRVDLPEGFLDI
jgi:16S rRNA processing protein RimM